MPKGAQRQTQSRCITEYDLRIGDAQMCLFILIYIYIWLIKKKNLLVCHRKYTEINNNNDDNHDDGDDGVDDNHNNNNDK